MSEEEKSREERSYGFAQIETRKVLKQLNSSTSQMRTSNLEEKLSIRGISIHCDGFYDGLRAIDYLLETIDPANKDQVKGLKDGLREYLGEYNK